MKSFPEIITERLLLIQIIDSDLENIYRGLSHPQVIQFYAVSYNSLEETKEQMHWYADLEKKGTGSWFAICSKDTKIFYGAVGFNDVSKKHLKPEIQCILDSSWASPACRCMPQVCMAF